jgi:hypothetical protein
MPDRSSAIPPSDASGTVTDVIFPSGATSSTSATGRGPGCNCVASTRTVTSAVCSATSTLSVRTWCPLSTAPDSCTTSSGRHGPIEGNRGPKSQPQEKVALRRRVASGNVADHIPEPSFRGRLLGREAGQRIAEAPQEGSLPRQAG